MGESLLMKTNKQTLPYRAFLSAPYTSSFIKVNCVLEKPSLLYCKGVAIVAGIAVMLCYGGESGDGGRRR